MNNTFKNSQTFQPQKNRKANLSGVLAAGTVTGIATVTLSQPFELLKTRIQNNLLVQTGIFQTTRDIVRLEGLKTFYRGSVASYLGVTPIVSIRLFTFQTASRLAENKLGWSKVPSVIFSSALAALSSSLWSSPIELVRIQMQKAGSQKLYKSTSECFRYLMKNYSLRKGLFRGFNITLLRDVIFLGKSNF